MPCEFAGYVDEVLYDGAQSSPVHFGFDGQLVLHRIVAVISEGYYTRGDNCLGREKITNAMVIGVLAGYYKGEEYIDCRQNEDYLLYVKRVARRYPLRYARHLLGSAIRRLRRLWPQHS